MDEEDIKWKIVCENLLAIENELRKKFPNIHLEKMPSSYRFKLDEKKYIFFYYDGDIAMLNTIFTTITMEKASKLIKLSVFS